LGVIPTQHFAGGTAQPREFVAIDVAALAFGEAIEERCTNARLVGEEHTKSARAPLPHACHPLLDETATEIGIDQTSLRAPTFAQ
jgi:hypothetical protein